MTRYTLHVPEQYNDGREIPGHIFDQVELEILQAAGGFTRTAGTGGWRGDDGNVYVEPVQLYHIDSADPTTAAVLLLLAEDLARQLDQEAIYLTRQEITTHFVTAREEITA